jgi:hypothetical protein
LDAKVRDDGSVSYDDLDQVITWATINALADDWWSWQRLSGAEQEHDRRMVAFECVWDLMNEPSPRALDVIQALLDRARSDFDVAGVAAGPLEDLVSHSGNGMLVLDAVEALARRDAMWRQAVRGLYLGDDLPQEVLDRLLIFRSETR